MFSKNVVSEKQRLQEKKLRERSKSRKYTKTLRPRDTSRNQRNKYRMKKVSILILVCFCLLSTQHQELFFKNYA